MSITLSRPSPELLFSLTRLIKSVGSGISKAPNRLSAKTRKIPAMMIFTHGFAAKSEMPVAPKITAKAKPRAVNVPIIPRAYASESRSALPLTFSERFAKKDTVMGIIGKTQGVSNADAPAPIAKSRNDHTPSWRLRSISDCDCDEVAFDGDAADVPIGVLFVADGTCVLACRVCAVSDDVGTLPFASVIVRVNFKLSSSGGKQRVESHDCEANTAYAV